MNKYLRITALIMVCALFVIGCGDSPAANTEVAFTDLTANGSVSVSTTLLTLRFDQDIEGLAAGDITVEIDSPFTVSKGNLTSTGGGTYTLGVTIGGGETEDATPEFTVTVVKAGFTITQPSRSVTGFFAYVPPPDPGTVTIASSSDRNTTAINDVISVNLANLGEGEGDPVYEWMADGSVVGSGTTLRLTEAEVGKNITVRVQRAGWGTIWTPSSGSIGPIVVGYMVQTIARHMPNDEYRVFQNARSMDIDSNDVLYLASDVAYVGGAIVKIDTTTMDLEDSDWGAEIFSTDDINSGRYLTVGPDDDVYLVRIFQNDVSIYPQSGGNYTWRSAVLNTLTGFHNDIYGDIAVHPNGNIYLANDWGNNRFFKVIPVDDDPNIEGNPITTGIGSNNIRGITVGHDGFIYATEGYSDGAIRRIDPDTDEVTTWEVSKDWGDPFTYMRGLTFGNDDNYYVVDRVQGDADPVIRKITTDGVVTTIAGNTSGDGSNREMVDGLAFSQAKFFNPWGIAASTDGTVYVLDNARPGDNDNAHIRMIYYDISTTLP